MAGEVAQLVLACDVGPNHYRMHLRTLLVTRESTGLEQLSLRLLTTPDNNLLNLFSGFSDSVELFKSEIKGAVRILHNK